MAETAGGKGTSSQETGHCSTSTYSNCERSARGTAVTDSSVADGVDENPVISATGMRAG
jgi:hypothetical protein